MAEPKVPATIPQVEDNAIELKEKKRQKIIENLNHFFDSNDFKDSEGNPVRLENEYWPSVEDEEAYKKIISFIQSDKMKPFIIKTSARMEYSMEYEDIKSMLPLVAEYLVEATTFDSLKTKAEHDIRRGIESALLKASKEDTDTYLDAYDAYYNNRLSLKHIRNTLGVYETFFYPDDFSKVTNDLYTKGSAWQEPMVGPNGVEGKKYEFASNEEKLEATHDTANFIKSFFEDLEKISNSEELVKE